MQIIRVRLINSMGKTKGSENTPVEVLKELKNINTNEKGELIEFDRLNLEEIHVNLDNVEEANHLIYENSKEIFERNEKAFFIGGDHSISYSIVRALRKIDEDPFLIVFDAHADCDNPCKEPTHEEWLRKLIEEGMRKIILISARKIWKHERDFLKKNNIILVSMDVIQDDIEGVCDIVMEQARNASSFYISLDIDSVDPAHAPGVAYPEPGGLTSREMIYFIKRLSLLKNFRGGDIVEINPEKDINNITVKLGAKILSEMI